LRWITRSNLHLDRVATPWLIARFVDPAAEFEFLGWDVEPTETPGATWFGVPGVELGRHDSDGTCFHKTIKHFELEEPALDLMDMIIADGVADALGTPCVEGRTDRDVRIGATLNRIGLAMSVAFDDEEHLRAGMMLYEGLYTLCQIELLPVAIKDDLPDTMPERIGLLRGALGRP